MSILKVSYNDINKKSIPFIVYDASSSAGGVVYFNDGQGNEEKDNSPYSGTWIYENDYIKFEKGSTNSVTYKKSCNVYSCGATAESILIALRGNPVHKNAGDIDVNFSTYGFYQWFFLIIFDGE